MTDHETKIPAENNEENLTRLYKLNKDIASKDSTTELDWQKILNRSLEITGNARTYCSKVIMLDPENMHLASNDYILLQWTLNFISPNRWHVKQTHWEKGAGYLYNEWVTIDDMGYQVFGATRFNTEKGTHDETNQALLIDNSLTILQNENPSSYELYNSEGKRYLLLQYDSLVEKDNKKGFFELCREIEGLCLNEFWIDLDTGFLVKYAIKRDGLRDGKHIRDELHQMFSCFNDDIKIELPAGQLQDTDDTSGWTKRYDVFVNSYYISKPVEEISFWISFLGKKELKWELDKIYSSIAFFSEVFKQNPNKLSEWVNIIDKIQFKTTKDLFYLALLQSNSDTGREYLKNKHFKYNGESTEEIINVFPLDLDYLIPSTHFHNDLLWGAFFATGKPKYLVNIIDAASKYFLQQENFSTFFTAISAISPLATNASKHEIVLQTLKQELNKRSGDDKKFILKVLEQSNY